MALITARFQYSTVRAITDVSWMRDKYCRSVFFSNLTLKRSICEGINDPYLEPSDPKIIRDSKYPTTIKEKQILRFLADELKVKEELIWNEIMKHPKRKFLNMSQIQKSLKFLQNLGFSRQVIADSPAICFYPQGNIETGLGEITKNAEELYKLGYVNGFLKEDTPAFLCGSKSKDKRLHLCLYYMELPFDFNGNGIFNIDGYPDLVDGETK